MLAITESSPKRECFIDSCEMQTMGICSCQDWYNMGDHAVAFCKAKLRLRVVFVRGFHTRTIIDSEASQAWYVGDGEDKQSGTLEFGFSSHLNDARVTGTLSAKKDRCGTWTYSTTEETTFEFILGPRDEYFTDYPTMAERARDLVPPLM